MKQECVAALCSGQVEFHPLASSIKILPRFFMWLLYADESGSLHDPSQDFFILSGVAIFERSTYWVERELIEISRRFTPHDPFEIELHGSPMRGGRGVWRNFAPNERLEAAKDALRLCKKYKLPIFASVIYKPNAAGVDILELAFEQLSSRFDQFLQRKYRKYNDPQRGIIVLDKSSTEIQIQHLARMFKFEGHTWGNYVIFRKFLFL